MIFYVYLSRRERLGDYDSGGVLINGACWAVTVIMRAYEWEMRAFNASWVLVMDVAGARYKGPTQMSELATEEKNPSRR